MGDHAVGATKDMKMRYPATGVTGVSMRVKT